MTDVSQHIPFQIPARGASAYESRRAARRREYIAYFTVIFLCALPLSFVAWALKSARRMEWPDRGPVSSAWSQANIITPMILSA